jgi:antitoxin component YwqK of YwqJK toxin-antitoxin module
MANNVYNYFSAPARPAPNQDQEQDIADDGSGIDTFADSMGYMEINLALGGDNSVARVFGANDSLTFTASAVRQFSITNGPIENVTVTGAMQLAVITGNSSNNYIQSYGSAANGFANADEIRGGGGHDTIIGGNGADRLFGDEGDDVIYWDAADFLADVQGGTGFDTLIMTTGSVPVTFNLVAQGFERAIYDTADVGNTQAWTRFLSDFNTSWQLVSQDIYMDSGSREFINYDFNSSQSWSRFTNYFNAGGQVTAQRIQLDNNSLETRFFDVQNNMSWSSYIDYVNAGGSLTARRFFQDGNGNFDTTFYDWNNTQSWTHQTEFQFANGSMHARQTFYDNGTYLNEYNDVNNTANWSSYQELFTAGGVRISGSGVYDNGSAFIL